MFPRNGGGPRQDPSPTRRWSLSSSLLLLLTVHCRIPLDEPPVVVPAPATTSETYRSLLESGRLAAEFHGVDRGPNELHVEGRRLFGLDALAGTGFRPGDIVSTLQGEPIDRRHAIRDILANVPPDETTLWAEVDRSGTLLVVELPLDSPLGGRPAVSQLAEQVTRPGMCTATTAPVGDGAMGLRLDGVDGTDLCGLAGFENGDVIVDVVDYGGVRLHVRREGKTYGVDLNLGDDRWRRER